MTISLRILTVSLFICGLWSCSNPKSGSQTTEELVADTTPAEGGIMLADLDGNPINLEDYKGKRVFLNFWATWCKPCIAEMPDIENAKQALEDVVFLAASDENIEKIERFTKKYDFTFQFVQLKTDYGELGVNALPTTLIFNEAGEMVYQETGARKWDDEEMLELISKQ